MRTPKPRNRLMLLIGIALAISLSLAACGGGSDDAKKLLQQTFSGPHTVNSGNLSLGLTMQPSGSSTLKGPVSLSFGGPFQSRGKGRLPASNFTISLSSSGRSGSLGILSTGTAGYVTLQGTSYQMPASTFQRLESSFSGMTSSTSGGGGALGRLGIDPLHWLQDPSVVGDESVAGTQTTHVRASINVAALLGDLNTFLQKAGSLSGSGAGKVPTSIPANTRAKIAAKVQNPTFDVWTGKSDKTVRRLQIKLTVPVTGQISTLLGGLRQAQISLTMQYANLNQPQAIQAPSAVRPFSEFTVKLRTFLSGLQGALAGGSLGSLGAGSGGATGSSPGAAGATGTTGSGSSALPGSTGAGAGASGGSNVQRYSQCVQAAGQDVTKLQSCAALLSGK